MDARLAFASVQVNGRMFVMERADFLAPRSGSQKQNPPATRQLRFYEKNPTVKQAVTLLFKFPADIRTILAKGFCAIAEKDFRAGELIHDLKSLGKEKVLALYKSRLKRREYDSCPWLSKAMNYLMILEPSDQWFLAVKLQEMIDVVRDYLVACKASGMAIRLHLVECLTNTYAECGAREAKNLYQNVVREIRRIAPEMKTRLKNVVPPVGPVEAIASENSGMRIRFGLDPT